MDGPLQVGDLMVVEGVQGLRDGQLVEPMPFGNGQAGDYITTLRQACRIQIDGTVKCYFCMGPLRTR